VNALSFRFVGKDQLKAPRKMKYLNLSGRWFSPVSGQRGRGRGIDRIEGRGGSEGAGKLVSLLEHKIALGSRLSSLTMSTN